MDNRRIYTRIPSDAIVEMSHPGLGNISVRARDLSEGGIAVDMGMNMIPPIGTVVQVVIKRHTGAINIDPVAMEVRHVQEGGRKVGLMFV